MFENIAGHGTKEAVDVWMFGGLEKLQNDDVELTIE